MRTLDKENLAVVFDMDGVIFDTERLYIDCVLAVAEKFGMKNAEEVCHRCIGITNAETSRILKESYGEDFPLDDYWREASGLFWERYPEEGGLPTKEGVRELLDYLADRKIPCVIASSTKTDVVRREIRDAGLLDQFTGIVGGDQVSRSKPEPDIFLRAAEVLGKKPEDCIVIEDSYNGIRAAVAANMIPVMVPDLLPPTEEMEEKAWKILHDLKEMIPVLEEIRSE